MNRVRTVKVAALSDRSCRFGKPGALFFLNSLQPSNGHGNHGRHGPPHPSLNLGSPPLTMRTANPEDDSGRRMGDGTSIRAWGGVSVLSVANMGWVEGQRCFFKHLPEISRRASYST